MAKGNRNNSRLEVRLPEWMHDGVKQLSDERELSNNEFIRELIEKELTKNGIKKPAKPKLD